MTPNSISNKKSHVKVKVGGDFACFSRPEFKVERVTYPVMTPSAARGLLEAIFWRPEFRYRNTRDSCPEAYTGVRFNAE